MRVRRNSQDTMQEMTRKSVVSGVKSTLSGKKTGNGVVQLTEQNALNRSVGEKKAAAQKMAFRIVQNAFSSDQKVDNQEKALQDHVAMLRDEMNQAGGVIKDTAGKIEDLRTKSDIAPDSQEEADLKLLMKARDAQEDPSSGSLTADEKKQVEEIEKQGLTDYQQQSMQIYAGAALARREMSDDTRDLMSSVGMLKGIKLARLGSQVMTDAKQQSDQILKAAGEEAVGTLLSAGKDHLDEEQKKAEDKAKEKADQQQKEQDRVDAAKEDSDQIKQAVQKAKENADEAKSQQANAAAGNGAAAQASGQTTGQTQDQNAAGNAADAVSAIPSLQQVQDDVKRKVDDMISKMKLTEEDVKGVAVDEKK